LAEVYVVGGDTNAKLDLNWLTNWRNHALGDTWIDRYWDGEPYLQADPIWEALSDARVLVLGTELRDRAYAKVAKEFPESLGVLEIARIASWLDSDLGNVCAFLLDQGNELSMDLWIDWRDATRPEYLGRLAEYLSKGGAVYHADLGPHLQRGDFGKVPDLTRFGVRRRKDEALMFRAEPAL
jgi:hypothetical protein